MSHGNNNNNTSSNLTTTYKNHLVPRRYKALHTRYIMDNMDM